MVTIAPSTISKTAPLTPHQRSVAHGKFRPDIEGLRGIAVLLVVLFHCGVPGFGGGFIGVDIFFALSGYLITGLIVAEIESSGRLSYRNFYARRVRRLLPASGLVVISTLLLGSALYSPLELFSYAKWASYTSLYFTNNMLIRDSANYFGSDAALNPYLHTWSLALEEQFYFFWPALIAITMTRLKSRRRLAQVLFVLSVFSFALCVWLTRVRQPWAFFSLPPRAWEFGVGGIACLLSKSDLQKHAAALKTLGWAGLAAILAAAFLFSPGMRFPGYEASLPVGGTIFALLAGASGVPFKLQRLLGHHVLQYLGKLSYSWYLWHWPVLIFSLVCFPAIPWTGKLLAGVLALLLAQITFVLVEQPVRRNRFLGLRPALSLSLAVLIPLAGIVIAPIVQGHSLTVLAQGNQAAVFEAATDHAAKFQEDCLTHAGSFRLLECEYRAPDAQATVVLFGDSHAAHWFPALQQLAEQRHWRIITLMKSSCPGARVQGYSVTLKRPEAECPVWREAALARIAQLKPYVVVMAEKDAAVTSRPGLVDSRPPITPQEWENGLRSTLSALSAQHLRTIVIADVPRAKFDIPICLSRAAAHRWATQDCSLPRNTALNVEAQQAEAAAVNVSSSARFVDFSGRFCSGSVCQPFIGGQVVYRDSNHLTSRIAQSFAPALGSQIDALLATKPADRDH